jgi:hypothetical protein
MKIVRQTENVKNKLFSATIALLLVASGHQKSGDFLEC